MFDLATVNPEDAAKSVELAKSAVDAIESKLPGIGLYLNDRAQVKHSKRMMDSINELRAYGERIGLDQYVIDSLTSNALRNMGADENTAACVIRALPGIEDPNDFERLDDEKAAYWRTHAEKASSDEMRQLLGAILAGEVNKPGAVSKRTLSIVADMGKDDAETFEKLCAMSVGGYIESEALMTPPRLFAVAGRENTYCEETVVFAELANMEALGLVNMHSQYTFDLSDGVFVTAIGEQGYAIRKNSEKTEFGFSSVTFTNYGTELASLFMLGSSTKLLPAFKKHVENSSFSLIEIG